MFADGTNISTFGSSSPEIENKINNDLHNETNKLTLNAMKTEFMLITSKRKLRPVSNVEFCMHRMQFKQCIMRKPI